MKQVVQNYRSGELKVDELPDARVRAGGVLVDNHYSIISAGTERSTVQVAQKSLVGKAKERPDLVKKVIGQVQKRGLSETMKMVFSRLDSPVALGYSCAGVVREVGRDVEGLQVGDRVACAGQNYASHAEKVFIPKNLTVKIPDGVDTEDAAYVAIGSIALQSIRQADPKLGDIVAVIGLGMIGQLVVQMLVANGCRVIASDLDASKCDMALAHGAELAVQPDALEEAAMKLTSGNGVDSVIIPAATKSSSPVSVAGEITRRKGKVVVLGAVGMDLPREPYYKKEIDFLLSSSYGPGRYDPEYEEKGNDYPYGYVRWTEQRNMDAFLRMIAAGKVDVKKLTTHRFTIDEAEAAYQLITENTEPYLGISLAYPIERSDKALLRVDLVTNKATKAVSLGVIGAGNHVKDMLLPHFKSSAVADVRAICTGTGINAKAAAEKYQSAFCTTDSQEVLADESINAVLIGTRHDSHANLVLRSLLANKHVFVEKPLCLNEQQLNEIVEHYPAAAQRGLVLSVGFNRRYSSHAEKIRNAFARRQNPVVMVYRVNAGELPSSHWAQDAQAGGGRMIGEGCHFIDFMQYVTEANVTHVYAQRIAQHSSGINSDQTIVTLNFSDGSIGTLIYAAGGERSLEKEYFECHGDGLSVVMRDFKRTEIYKNGSCDTYKSSKQDKGFEQEVMAFIEAVTGNPSGVIPFASIVNTTQSTFAAVNSMADGMRYEIG